MRDSPSDGDKDRRSRREVLAAGLGVAAAVVAVAVGPQKILDTARRLLPDNLASIRKQLGEAGRNDSGIDLERYDRVIEKLASVSREPRALMSGIINEEIVGIFRKKDISLELQGEYMNRVLRTSEYWLDLYGSIRVRYYNDARSLEDFIRDDQAKYSSLSSFYFDVTSPQPGLYFDRVSDKDSVLLKRLIEATAEWAASEVSRKQENFIDRNLPREKETLKAFLLEKLMRHIY